LIALVKPDAVKIKLPEPKPDRVKSVNCAIPPETRIFVVPVKLGDPDASAAVMTAWLVVTIFPAESTTATTG